MQSTGQQCSWHSICACPKISLPMGGGQLKEERCRNPLEMLLTLMRWSINMVSMPSGTFSSVKSLSDSTAIFLNRTLAMIEKYFGGEIPQPLPYDVNGPVDIIGEIQLKNFTETINPDFDVLMEKLSFNHALDKIWFVINHANKLIEDEAPWNLWKTKKIDKLSGVLYTLAETLRIIAIYLFPFIPSAAEEMWRQLNVSEELSKINFESEGKWGLLKSGTKIKKGPALFPRIETARKS